MRTLTIRIDDDAMSALENAGKEFSSAWETESYTGESMSFESPTALFRVLTPARWNVLSSLQKTGHCGLRELARRIGRDASAVLRDVTALSERGLVEKDENGRLFVPFERIHMEFDLAQAA